MTRRSFASILACVLLVALLAAVAFLPVPYVTMSPGPTQDVLAEVRGEEIVAVEGRRTYPTRGTLALTTIYVTAPTRNLNLAQVLGAWFDRTKAVYPRDLLYQPDETVQDVRTESVVDMVSSQDTAIAAALGQLGYDLPMITEVFNVAEGGPAQGKLEARDRIVSVNGRLARNTASVVEGVQKAGVGGDAVFVVRRSGQTRTVTVQPEPAADDPQRAVVGVTVGGGFTFPFDLSLNIDETIGGPSAGLVMALGVFDTLTPGALTDGRDVAGTGTISADGAVGPISGIQQKIVAAADSGAELFLVPPANCEAALGAAVDEEEIELVVAPSLRSAIRSVGAYVEGDEADLPRCG